MKFRKLICILLSVCMLFSMLSVLAFASEDAEATTEDTATEEKAEGEEKPSDTAQTDDTGNFIVDEAGMTGDGTTGNPADLATFTLVDENKNLAFYINDITGFFAVVNKKTNAIWYSNPLDWEKDQIAKAANKEQLHSQLLVTYLNSSYDTLTISSSEAHIVSEHAGNKQIMTYVFSGATRNFSIPISYELKETYLDIKLMVDDIEENSDARITQITLLPFMGAAGLKDSGYGLIPDGSGSLMQFNKTCKNLSQYVGYIYNRDLTASSNNASYVDLNETVSLPVYGMCKNGAAYLAIITEGDGTSAIKASVSRLFNSYNSISPHMVVRDTQVRKNSSGSTGAGVYYSEQRSGNLSLRVYPLDAANSSYVGMAKKYREYLIAEKGLTKLAEDSKVSNSLNIDLFCGVKSPMHFLGIPYTGVKELTSFNEVQGIITDLKEKNVENMVITLSGWSKGGMETTVTTKFNPESKLGGKSDAKDLINFAKEKDVTLVFDNDVQTFYSATSSVKKFKHTAFDLSNTPVTVFPFDKSLNVVVKAGKFNHLIHPTHMVTFANEFVDNALKAGVENFSFKTAGVDPYTAYNKDDLLTRDKSSVLMEQLFKSVAEKTEGAISTRVGNSYVLGSVDNIVEVPVYSSYLIMSQTTVPFYQIALRGYVNMAPEALNLSSEVSELELKCAETGLSLFYQLMDSDSTDLLDTSFADYYACSYDDYVGLMTETYSRMKKVYDAVGNSSIKDYQIFDDNVRITTFENGAKVYVNYANSDATVNGVKVPARGYVAVGGGK